MAYNIVVLDCQRMFVDGLKSILSNTNRGFEVSKSFCKATELFDHINTASFPDLIVTELNIPDMDGVQVVKQLRKLKDDLRILVLSTYTNPKLVRNAMLGGADGYISKNSVVEELLYGLEEIFEGNTFLGNGISTTPAAFNPKIKDIASVQNYKDNYTIKQKLTKREREILSKITQGKTNRDIASELFISDQTVGVHRKNIMRKLGTRNTVTLIKFALEHDLV